MIIDFEHHYTPYEIWKRRGGKKGEVVRIFSPEGMKTYIAKIRELDLDKESIDAILGTNGVQLLRL